MKKRQVSFEQMVEHTTKDVTKKLSKPSVSTSGLKKRTPDKAKLVKNVIGSTLFCAASLTILDHDYLEFTSAQAFWSAMALAGGYFCLANNWNKET